jgi:[ribosomal protein S5]-alanine N-acetyltransferase
MQFSHLPKSEHTSVMVRPITKEDIEHWYAYLSVPSSVEHTSWNLHSADELLPYVWNAELPTPSLRLRLAIADRKTDRLVGTVGFHTVSPENQSAEIAYDLAPSVRGKGIATYACSLLVGWAHTHVGLIRVQATVLESNNRSMAVLERCGFEREGLLRSYRMVRGHTGNFCMYSHVTLPQPAT